MKKSQKEEDPSVQRFREYIVKNHEGELERMIQAHEEEEHYSIAIDFMKLADEEPGLASRYLQRPDTSQKQLDRALSLAQEELLRRPHGDEPKRGPLGTRFFKPNSHARVQHLPPGPPEVCMTGVPRAADVGRYVQLRGTVVRTGPVRILEWRRKVECAKCHRSFYAYAAPELRNEYPRIDRCAFAECDGASFRVDAEGGVAAGLAARDRYRDYQEIRLQEKQSGAIPRSIPVALHDDLVDVCQAGDDVTVVGVVTPRWSPLREGRRAEPELFLMAQHLRVHSAVASGVHVTEPLRRRFEAFWAEARSLQRPLAYRDKLLRAICPQLCGMYIAKLALALVLAGGVAAISDDHSMLEEEEEEATHYGNGTEVFEGNSRDRPVQELDAREGNSYEEEETWEEGVHPMAQPIPPSSHRTIRKPPPKSNAKTSRGDAHLLLIGDPGTGKSQLLRFASLLSARSVLTTGVGTTTAGLTVAAVKDPSGEWMLEGGALVLADGGVCCIDEFSSIRTQDKAAIHEAMEQQTLSVAKAGIVCTLRSRCTVVAATNPKIKYDPSQSLYVNTSIGSPLLSRFDIVLVLLDQHNPGWDTEISSFILESRAPQAENRPAAVGPEELSNPGSNADRGVLDRSSSNSSSSSSSSSMFSLDDLRAYLSLIKSTKFPALSPRAEEILSRYYQRQRAMDIKDSSRTTARLLASLVRLAQAHARLLFKNVVEVVDALVAVFMMECSIHTSSVMHIPSIVHSDFPPDADGSFLEIQRVILNQLGLSESWLK